MEPPAGFTVRLPHRTLMCTAALLPGLALTEVKSHAYALAVAEFLLQPSVIPFWILPSRSRLLAHTGLREGSAMVLALGPRRCETPGGKMPLHSTRR